MNCYQEWAQLNAGPPCLPFSAVCYTLSVCFPLKAVQSRSLCQNPSQEVCVNQTPGNLGDLSKWPGPKRLEYFSTSGNQLTGDTQSSGLSELLLASASKVKWNVAQPGSGPGGTSSRDPFPFITTLALNTSSFYSPE